MEVVYCFKIQLIIYFVEFPGEGMALTVDERMKLAERWYEVTRKYDLKMLLNIGGLPLPELYLLAEHAEKLKVDAVMLMPDLFYKPKSVEDLVYYIKDIVIRMPTRPIFYYHIPIMTDVYCEFGFFLKTFMLFNRIIFKK